VREVPVSCGRLSCRPLEMKNMLEPLLEPESVNVPDCRCGIPMIFERMQKINEDMKIEVFHCRDCGHEMRLTLWTSGRAPS
jgi:hypothetical protein